MSLDTSWKSLAKWLLQLPTLLRKRQLYVRNVIRSVLQQFQISPRQSLAIHAAAGTCFASIFCLFPPLRNSFSPNSQTMLPTVAQLAAWYVGVSMEDTFIMIISGIVGTSCAMFHTLAWQTIFGYQAISVSSWLGVAAILESALFIAVCCLLPLSDNFKMTVVGYTGNFVLLLFSDTDSSTDVWLGWQYIYVTTLTWCALLVGYCLPIPVVGETVRSCDRAAYEAQLVVEGCAEILTEATEAFLAGQGGETWRSLARRRMQRFKKHMARAREHNEFSKTGWASNFPVDLMLSLSEAGRARLSTYNTQRELALYAAQDALDVCHLMVELTATAGSRDESESSIALRTVASVELRSILQRTTQLLLEFVRGSFTVCSSSLLICGQIVKPGSIQLRRFMWRDLRSSLFGGSSAVQDFWLSSLQSDFDSEYRSDLMSVHADTSSFLFLVHALATDLLQLDAQAQRLARQALRGPSHRQPHLRQAAVFTRAPATKAHKTLRVSFEADTNQVPQSEQASQNLVDLVGSSEQPPILDPTEKAVEAGDDDGEEDEDGEEEELEGEEEEDAEEGEEEKEVDEPIAEIEPAPVPSEHGSSTSSERRNIKATSTWLSQPFVPHNPKLVVQRTSMKTRLLSLTWARVSRMCRVVLKRLRRTLKGWVKIRGRNSLKVTLCYVMAMLAEVYLFDFDSTVVYTVPLLASYGTTYSGGSLQQSIQLGTGITAGAVIGGTLQQLLKWAGTFFHHNVFIRVLMAESVIFVCMYYAMIITFREGPYAYVAFNAAYTGIVFLLDPTTDFQSTVQYTLYGCLLTVLVELMVLPVDAEELLRSRLAAALAASVTSLAALLRSSAPASGGVAPYSPPPTPGGALTEEEQRAQTPAPAEELADLTDHLVAAGVYAQYVKWRVDYLRWRRGEAQGAKGEPGGKVVFSAAAMGLFRSRSAPAILECTLEPVFRLQPVLSRRPSFAEGMSELLPETEETMEHQDDFGQSGPIVLQSDLAFKRGIASAANMFDDEAYDDGDVEQGEGGLATPFLPEADTNEPGYDIEHAVADVFVTVEADINQDVFAAGQLPTVAFLLGESGTALDEESALIIPTPVRLGQQPSSFDELKPRGRAGQITLSHVLRLLQEIREAMEPVEDLVLQAAERLDGKRVDTYTWVSLANTVNMIHLRVLVLYRIARRSRQGVDIAKLLNSEEGEATSGEVLEAFAASLTAAMLTVLGKRSVTYESANGLEDRLRTCAKALVRSLSERSRETARSGSPLAHMSAEVLAGTSASMLTALLQDASWILSTAVTLSAE